MAVSKRLRYEILASCPDCNAGKTSVGLDMSLDLADYLTISAPAREGT